MRTGRSRSGARENCTVETHQRPMINPGMAWNDRFWRAKRSFAKNGLFGFLSGPRRRQSVPTFRTRLSEVFDPSVDADAALRVRIMLRADSAQMRDSEIVAPLNWLSALITTDCLLPRVVSVMLAENPGAVATI
jgi:hypothetical protein